MYSSHKSFPSVVFESAFVGSMLVVLVMLLRRLAPKTIPEIAILFLAGAFFHLTFEYTGLNTWYSVNYCNLIYNK